MPTIRKPIRDYEERDFVISYLKHRADIGKPLDVPRPFFFEANIGTMLIHDSTAYRFSTNPTKDHYIRIYTRDFGLKKIGDTFDLENKYFKTFSEKIGTMKKEFLEVAIGDIEDYISAEDKEDYGEILRQRIEKKYGYEGLPSNVLKLAGNIIYSLLSMKEFILSFEESFEPGFFKRIAKMSKTSDPEVIYQILLNNTDKISKRALSNIKDKISSNKKGALCCINGSYYVPKFKERKMTLINDYTRRVEKKIKLDAIDEFFGE